MTEDNREFYARRIAQVLGFIGAHLDEELSLDRLSAVAGFSKFHFTDSSARLPASAWPRPSRSCA